MRRAMRITAESIDRRLSIPGQVHARIISVPKNQIRRFKKPSSP
jgi:hypothetical protein